MKVRYEIELEPSDVEQAVKDFLAKHNYEAEKIEFEANGDGDIIAKVYPRMTAEITDLAALKEVPGVTLPKEVEDFSAGAPMMVSDTQKEERVLEQTPHQEIVHKKPDAPIMSAEVKDSLVPKDYIVQYINKSVEGFNMCNAIEMHKQLLSDAKTKNMDPGMVWSTIVDTLTKANFVRKEGDEIWQHVSPEQKKRKSRGDVKLFKGLAAVSTTIAQRKTSWNIPALCEAVRDAYNKLHPDNQITKEILIERFKGVPPYYLGTGWSKSGETITQRTKHGITNESKTIKDIAADAKEVPEPKEIPEVPIKKETAASKEILDTVSLEIDKTFMNWCNTAFNKMQNILLDQVEVCGDSNVTIGKITDFPASAIRFQQLVIGLVRGSKSKHVNLIYRNKGEDKASFEFDFTTFYQVAA